MNDEGPRRIATALSPVIDSTKTEQKDFRVLPDQLAGAVGVVGVGVDDGKASEPADLPGVGQGDDHVVEAAGSPELAPPGVWARGRKATPALASWIMRCETPQACSKDRVNGCKGL